MKNYLLIIPAVIIAAVSAQANSASVSGTLQKILTQENYFNYDCLDNPSGCAGLVTTTEFTDEELLDFNAEWDISTDTLTVDIGDTSDVFENGFTEFVPGGTHETQIAQVIADSNDSITTIFANNNLTLTPDQVSLTIAFDSAYLIKTSERSSNPSLQIGGYDQTFKTYYLFQADVSEVPVPAAAWLFGSALIGLGICRKK